MKTLYKLAPLTSALFLVACATPTMDKLPKQQPGKATIIAYSSTLNPTSSFKFYINQKSVGNIQGDKVKIVYLEPGNYNMRIAPPNVNVATNQTVTVKSGQYYFYDAFTTTTGRLRKTTYHFEPVSQDAALAYLQGPAKFTGWSDLVTNSLSGKRIW